jgi:outer membrane protein assembly factor BamB
MRTAAAFDAPNNRGKVQARESDLAELRVWPAVVMVLLFWVFLYVNRTAALSPGFRFISRVGTYAIMLACFLGWWLSRSSIRWRDRFLAIAVAVGAGILARLLADRSIDSFGLLLSAFPWVVTAWTGWLIVGRALTPKMQRVGFVVAMLLVCSYFTLIRFEGLEGTQAADFAWRWQPTHEQQFLAGQERQRSERPAVETPTSQKPWQLKSGDCPEYRGRNRDGVITGVRVVAKRNDQSPKLLWKHRVGPGWSGMIVVDGHLVTQEQRDQQESVVCYDASTGEEIWAHDDPVRFEEALAGAGPRGTPTFVDGRIYALGAKGTLNCLRAETGEVVWAHDIAKDAELAPEDLPQWGYSVSPLVVDGLVIVFAGSKKSKNVLAYQADDGILAWTAAAGAQSYSSPQLVTLAGVRQVLMDDSKALSSLNPADGKILWSYPAQNAMALPMLQPHQTPSGDILAATDSGLTLLGVKKDGDNWVVTPKWSSNRFRPNFNDFVVQGNHMYGLDDGILCCFDLTTGDRLWKKGRYGHGQVLMLADQNVVLISSDKGELILANVSAEAHEVLGRFQAIEGKTWNSPVLVGSRVYLRNGEEMAAYELTVERTSDFAG